MSKSESINRKPIKEIEVELTPNRSLLKVSAIVCNVKPVRELEVYTAELETKLELLECCGNCRYINVNMEPYLFGAGEMICDFWCDKEFNGSDFRVKGCANWEIKN